MTNFQVGIVLGIVCVTSHVFGYFFPIIECLWYVIYCSFMAVLYVAAISVGVWHSYRSGYWQTYVSKKIRLEPTKMTLKKTKEKYKDLKFSPGKAAFKQTALVSRNVDDAIDELITLLLRDYVTSWHGIIVKQQSLFCKQLKTPIRQMLFTFRNRWQKIDDVKLFSSDIINIATDHFQRMRNAVINPAEKIQPYRVFPFLSDKELELEYLRNICEFLLTTLLPPEYGKNNILRLILREVFSASVFYTVVDKLCDPDSINLKLISYLKQQQIQAEKLSRTYAYAETYEDFIKMIQECSNVEVLQRMRYYVVTEIMEATTISNVKRSKGIDADKEFNPQKTNKGDLLQARNLSRYLNQLRFAKGLCEKRLKLHGGPDYVTSPRGSTDAFFEDKVYIPGKKVLSMSVIIQSSFCRRHFSKFLQKEEVHSLLGFWEAVEDMKLADKEIWHKLGNDIVQMYIHNQASAVRLSKNTLKGIEEFMMANKGPEAFFQAQEETYKMLEQNFYASFIVSDIYHKMLTDSEKQGIDFTQETLDDEEEAELPLEDTETEKDVETSDVSVLFDHSSYARSQLKVLTEKLSYKRQALQALRNNPKCEKKVIMMMENEIEDLVKEQSMLENHIEKTELWIEYLGIWQASITDALEKKENDKLVPYFIIRVHLSSDAEYIANKMSGWVVSKSLNSFHSLHQKLVPAAYWLKKIELPTKPRFKSLDKNYLEKAKSSLQTFLSAVTKDDGLNKSEALYDFLSPSPEYMKHPPCPPKKPFKFNLFQFFKGVQKPFSPFEETEEEELLFLDDTDSKEDKKDSIAEPLYTLIGEIFELKGVFYLLRKTLILFVQITYGQTINRQLRETVAWILSEPMLLFYLQLFHDTMWPTGRSPPSTEERTAKETIETRLLAKQMFLTNTPEILCKLMGQQNAKKGMSKIFDALQNKTLNKQLTYKIFEAFLYEYAPELKKISSLYSIDEI